MKLSVNSVRESVVAIGKYIRENKTKEQCSGHVYLLHNLSGNIAKIGKAKDCRVRWKEYQCPHNWVPKVAIEVDDQTKAEGVLLDYMDKHYTLSNGKEFFWCDNIEPIRKFMESKFGESILHQI